MGGWMWVYWLLLLLGLASLVVVAVRTLGGGISRDSPIRDPRPGAGGSLQPARSRACEILDERYARGELSTEEYHEPLHTMGNDA